MIKQFVEFMFPGIFMSESTIKEISNRSTQLDIPKNCFGYKFFDVQEITAPNGEVLRGKRQNESGMFYIGEVFTLDQIKIKFPESKILIFNMENNGWNRVVKTRAGNFQPFQNGDVIIPG